MNAPLPPQPRRLTRQIGRSDPGFARVVAAFFLGGFATFALLYSVQPLLPIFARVFDLSPARSSLALSVSTLVMAPALVIAGSASEVLGRKRMMIASLAASALATLAASLARDWNVLLLLRALTGLALSGLPAVAMAYLADEIAPESLGLAMGLYIAGSTLGGMAGRLIVVGARRPLQLARRGRRARRAGPDRGGLFRLCAAARAQRSRPRRPTRAS